MITIHYKNQVTIVLVTSVAMVFFFCTDKYSPYSNRVTKLMTYIEVATANPIMNSYSICF